MKKILILILFQLALFNANSQESLYEDLKVSIISSITKYNSTFSESITNEFLKLDSVEQSALLDYFKNYSEDSILYLNIDKMREWVSRLFYKSSYNSLRQKATILLLDTYRLSKYSYDVPICWYQFAKQTDFNDEAKGMIINILQVVPFSKVELEILYKNELNLQKISLYGDTLRIRIYKKKSFKDEIQLQDSLAENIALNNVRNLSPEKSNDLGISMLASWLDMQLAIPYIEKRMKSWEFKNVEIYNFFKLPLARLGNKKYESELLDEMILTQKIDLHTAGFICTGKTIDVILAGLKLKGKPRQIVSGVNSKGELVLFEVEGDNYSCTYLKDLVFKNLIENFPFKYDIMDLTMCKISENDIYNVIEWIEKNKNQINLNRDYH